MQPIKNILTELQNPAIFLLTAFTVFSVNAAGQPVLKIGEYMGCINKEVMIPIDITNMQNIAALTLYIKVDTNCVDFVGVSDVNTAFQTGNFVSNLSNGNIILSWFSTVPATIDSGSICKLQLFYNGGETSFHFQDNCEFVEPDLSVVEDVEYNDGWIINVSGLQPMPETQEVVEGTIVTFSTELLDNADEYQWQMGINNQWVDITDDQTFSGVLTNQLIIHTNYTLNGAEFRCIMSNDSCEVNTKTSTLVVNPNTVLVNTKDETNLFPNPFKDSFSLIYNGEKIMDDQIIIYDLQGKKVLVKHSIQGHNVVNHVDFDSEQHGIFFLTFYDEHGKRNVLKLFRD